MVDLEGPDARIKLRHLALTVAVADSGSMARAAEKLQVSQPVITRSVQDLEEILGVTLFTRKAKGVVPTPIGETFIGHARAVLSQVRQASQDVSDQKLARSGTVRVGTHLAGSTLLLPQAILNLKAQNPRVQVQVVEGTPDRLLDELIMGELDMVVGRLRPSLPEDFLRNESLYQEPIGLVTRPDHPAQLDGSFTLATLVDYPWVLPVEQTTLRQELEQLFLAEGLDLPRNRLDCNALPTTRALVLGSDSIAVVPLLVSHLDDKLSALPMALEPLRRPVGITTNSARFESPNVQAMTEHLRVVGREIASWLTVRPGLPAGLPSTLAPGNQGNFG